MGNIELAAPVAHIWFARGVPSRLALLLDISPRHLERVLYFAQYVVMSVDDAVRQDILKGLKDELARQSLGANRLPNGQVVGGESDTVAKLDKPLSDAVQLQPDLSGVNESISDLESRIASLENLKPLKLIAESQYQELKSEYGDFFEAGMGAEAVLRILKELDLEKLRQNLIEEVRSSAGQRRKKASKRLRIVEAFWRSANKPEWMVLTVLPVLPPELRPIVQLDGGRFATSDLNDLYRRVINRNNRLRRLIDLGAPEIIVRNEKRMLQEAVDALIDNGRRGRVPTVGTTHRLKSLSDMLRGKQGRFRQNLLGKRVDYSGRSVIVVGPELRLYQCGLPKHMALELFKPFVMRQLIEQGYAHNIKSARRQVEKARPEVWDILAEVAKERPVLLNRAPTLHRLSVQAFEPVLIDGSAIQIHPLVCSAFNADFDGDQMAVHVPLSKAAVKEAREQMLSLKNMLLPSCGEPVMTPTLDMVLGCYYLTNIRQGAKGEGKRFKSFEDARLAYELGLISLDAEIEVRVSNGDEGVLKTSAGRIIFNEVLPPEFRFRNQVMDKGTLKRLVADCYRLLGHISTANVLDNLKKLGFEYATKSGTTIAASDVEVPRSKAKLLEEGDERVAVIESQFNRGLITDDERYGRTIEVWTEVTDKITDTISQSLDRYGGVYMMATSGAKGNISQIRQMAGMRGLMTDPAGRIIDFPIKASFREGLSVMEYFMSTHGARKGLADTALRTSNAGYLTRRLIDVAQDVIVSEEDCGSDEGIWLSDRKKERGLLAPLIDRLVGRVTAADVVDPKTGEIIMHRNEEIDEEKSKSIVDAGITEVYVRSPLGCHYRQGICQYCYGRDLARRGLVEIGTAVGIIAAQSIGEPGTQLTLRTFHTGGVVEADITSGLPRVEELFEARVPKGVAVLSEIDGIAEVIDTPEARKIKITSSEIYSDEYALPPGAKVVVNDDERVEAGTMLASVPSSGKSSKDKHPAKSEDQSCMARVSGTVAIEDGRLYIRYEEKDEREYTVPQGSHIRVKSGDVVKAGAQLVDGAKDPQDILRIEGREEVQRYLIEEVQNVYRSQGVNINDKHIEIIIRQMLRRVRVESPGDTELLSGDLIDRFDYEGINAKVLAEGGEPATAQTVLLGITRASLNTNSWLAAASFQETTRVLTEAAIWGKTDRLVGLKENVIIGRLIPSQPLSLAEETAQDLSLAEKAEKALPAVEETGLALTGQNESDELSLPSGE
jgi:DNA-directed RNA polymerase subunit beta'